MTMQLQQMIGLLQLSSVDLLHELDNIMADCVFLEWEEVQENAGIYGAKFGCHHFHTDGIDRCIQPETLRGKLAWQLDFLSLTPIEKAIAKILIDGVDDRGYLTVMPDEVVSVFSGDSLNIENVLCVLKKIQEFEPAGVAARTLPECLSLQIERAEIQLSVKKNALRLIDCHAEVLACEDFDTLKKKAGLTETEVREVLQLLRSLNPYPGLLEGSENEGVIIPDVLVTNIHNRWHVKLNRTVSPSLKINTLYAEAINSSCERNVESLRYWKGKLREARDFVRGLNNRYDTLLQVAGEIVARQKDYFWWGDEYMKALSMCEVARSLGIHESTVSRAVQNKFVQTPAGTVPMSYFFTPDVGGQGISSVALRSRIKKLISRECPDRPMNDSHIKQCLEGYGIRVSRRTIAKYRHDLGIASSKYRKHH